MKFTTNADVVGTSGQGYVFDVTRAQIESVFGAPTYETEDWEKVTVEWSIQFEDGTIATIYDWKRYEDDLGTPEMDEQYDWHVGGTAWRAVEIVAAMLGVEPRDNRALLTKFGIVS